MTLPGTGVVVAADDISSVFYQRVKLVTSEDGSTEGIGDTDFGSTRALWVDPRQSLASQAQDSSGLTTASTNYSIGDVLGAGWTFTNMARASGGGGFIKGVTVLDKADVMSACDLYLASASITFGTDNSGVSVSDSDAEKLIRLPGFGFTDLGGCRIASLDSLDAAYLCDATSLYVYAVTTVANSFFGAASDLRVRLEYVLA